MKINDCNLLVMHQKANKKFETRNGKILYKFSLFPRLNVEHASSEWVGSISEYFRCARCKRERNASNLRRSLFVPSQPDDVVHGDSFARSFDQFLNAIACTLAAFDGGLIYKCSKQSNVSRILNRFHEICLFFAVFLLTALCVHLFADIDGEMLLAIGGPYRKFIHSLRITSFACTHARAHAYACR